jgi:hypothetical protein
MGLLRAGGGTEARQEARRPNTPGGGALSGAGPPPGPVPSPERRAGPFPALGGAGAPAPATTWGLQACQGVSWNRPPWTAPREALARPQTGLRGTPAGLLPAGLFAEAVDIFRRPDTGSRHLMASRPQPEDPIARFPYLPIAAPLAQTRRRQRRYLQR